MATDTSNDSDNFQSEVFISKDGLMGKVIKREEAVDTAGDFSATQKTYTHRTFEPPQNLPHEEPKMVDNSSQGTVQEIVKDKPIILPPSPPTPPPAPAPKRATPVSSPVSSTPMPVSFMMSSPTPASTPEKSTEQKQPVSPTSQKQQPKQEPIEIILEKDTVEIPDTELGEQQAPVSRSNPEMLIPLKKTIPKDPLFAANVLKQQQPAPVTPGTEEKQGLVSKPKTAIQVDGPKEKRRNFIIRTYKSDVADALKTEKTSMVQMVLAEHKKSEKIKEAQSPTSKKNLSFIVASSLLIFFSVAMVGGGVYIMYGKKDATVGSVKNPSLEVAPLVFAEEQKELNITEMSDEKIRGTIQKEIDSTDIRLDFVKFLYFTKESTVFSGSETTTAKKEVSLPELFSDLNLKIPSSLTRSFDSGFMFGVHSFNGNQSFMILKTSYFESVFAGMLEWEPFFAQDILPIFAYKGSNLIYDKKLEDVVVKNRDLRVLYDDEGKIVLLYTFLDKNTVIITTNLDTLNEVISRLSKKK